MSRPPAALRLLGAAKDVLDIEVGTRALDAFAAELEQYYRELAERFEAVAEEQRPEDRMYV